MKIGEHHFKTVEIPYIGSDGFSRTPEVTGGGMIKRRDFLRLAGYGGLSLAFPGWLIGDRLLAQQEHPVLKNPVFSGTRPGTSFAKYHDPLPLITVMPITGVVNQ